MKSGINYRYHTGITDRLYHFLYISIQNEPYADVGGISAWNRSQDGQGIISYGYWTITGTPVTYVYGVMFMTDAFKKLMIEAFVPADSNNKGWNSGDGFMMSAPAQTRSQALHISNELMKKALQGYVLS